MKKQLPTEAISNELAQSVFFAQATEAQATMIPSHHDTKPPKHHATVVSRDQAAKTPRGHEAVIPPSDQAPTVASNQDAVISRHHDTTPPAIFETIRKAVKQFGKEAATHRFTEDEKRAIADIVYTYERQGYRTSENEITRIAIHWLLQDYQQYGVQSVLARLLESLHK